MSEAERRIGYDNRRVLIETERVLAPQFDNAALCVTGAQLELLRNLTTYLNWESTFVSEYHVGYYLTPTTGEWDSLQSIVADLEELLMVNEIGVHGWDGGAWRKLPLIWGYSGPYFEIEEDEDAAEGTNTFTFSTVPEGELWVIESVAAKDVDNVPALVRFIAKFNGTSATFTEDDNLTASRFSCWNGKVTLPGGGKLQVQFAGVTLNDHILATAIGYKMKIAE